MSERTPSPAGRRQAEPSRDGLGKPPWDVALLAQVRALEARVTAAEAEHDELVLTAHQLRARLAECRRRLDNWKLRQQAWGEERRELLRQLGASGVPVANPPSPSVTPWEEQ